MAKTEMLIQGHVGTIGRRCIICDARWDAKHPNDPNTIICPDCLETLRAIIKEKQDGVQTR